MILANDNCEHSIWHINDYDGTCTYLVETMCVDGQGAKQCGAQRRMPSKAWFENQGQCAVEVAKMTAPDLVMTLKDKRQMSKTAIRAARVRMENAINSRTS